MIFGQGNLIYCKIYEQKYKVTADEFLISKFSSSFYQDLAPFYFRIIAASMYWFMVSITPLPNKINQKIRMISAWRIKFQTKKSNGIISPIPKEPIIPTIVNIHICFVKGGAV